MKRERERERGEEKDERTADSVEKGREVWAVHHSRFDESTFHFSYYLL